MNEREANEIPKGARWLWDWKWWLTIAIISAVFVGLRVLNHTI